MVKFIEKRTVWDLLLEVVERKELEIEGVGTFDAARIELTVLTDFSGKFSGGIFGLYGNMALWVDAQERIPLIVEGRLDFGIISPLIEVVLTRKS